MGRADAEALVLADFSGQRHAGAARRTAMYLNTEEVQALGHGGSDEERADVGVQARGDEEVRGEDRRASIRGGLGLLGEGAEWQLDHRVEGVHLVLPCHRAGRMAPTSLRGALLRPSAGSREHAHLVKDGRRVTGRKGRRRDCRSRLVWCSTRRAPHDSVAEERAEAARAKLAVLRPRLRGEGRQLRSALAEIALGLTPFDGMPNRSISAIHRDEYLPADARPCSRTAPRSRS